MAFLYINSMNLTDFNFCNRGFFKLYFTLDPFLKRVRCKFPREGLQRKAHSKVELCEDL